MTDVATRERLEQFFRTRSKNPDTVAVIRYEPIIGGWSRLMARCWVEDNGEQRGYIVRSDPPPGVSIIDTDRAAEWSVLSTLNRIGKVPLPQPLWFDETGAELGSPSIVIEMVDAQSLISVARAADKSELAGYGRKLAELAGRLPLVSADDLGGCLAAPDSWDEYIDSRIQYWIDAERANPDRVPLMRLIAAHLKAQRPAPVPLGLVHGDFQTSNVLVQPDGMFLLVDWELAHVGDPREDLGWCLLASTTQPPDLVLADEDAFYDTYRNVSGYTEEQANPATTDYFLLIAAVTVYVGVIEQLAAVSRGEPTSMTVTYMTNAVAGMHNVLLNTLKRHAQATGGRS
jgi:aminoglycoside phosphotransferase (APT) family kinase protein